MPAPDKPLNIQLPPLEIGLLNLTVIGDSPLICHAWSAKAKKAMLDKQMKRAKVAKEAKDPERDYLESLYPLGGDRFGFPAVAFKSAAVDACSQIDCITKVQARGAFHVVGEIVPIEGAPTLREDMVRVGMGTADIRYRGQFDPWRATLRVRFNQSVLSAEQITHLFNVAGFSVGVGEWRPQRDGSYGMFHVATQVEETSA